MQLINVEDLVIVDRQRKEVPKAHTEKLAASIKRTGLLQAIVLRDDCKTLVAGESRVTAIAKLAKLETGYQHNGVAIAAGHAPYVVLGDCDELMAQEAEFYENSMRMDLTWQDKDAAVLKIKNLMGAQHQAEDKPEPTNHEVGKFIAEQKEDNPEPKEVHKASKKVMEATLRDQYKDDERVKKAKSASEANKIIRKDLEEKKRAQLAEEFSSIETHHVIECGDCTEMIKEYDDAVFDVVVSDPIYGINADAMHMFQRVQVHEGGHHEYDDSWENWVKMFDIMPAELYRVTKEEAALYMFCDINRFFDFRVEDEDGGVHWIPGLKTRLEGTGWRVWPRPLIWFKGNIGSIPRPEHGPRYTSEYIIYATKGDKKVTGIYYDVIGIQQTTNHAHAAGKPPELYYELLRRSALPGDTVLDFNAGSFPILQAANELGVTAHAWELNEKWMKHAELRKTLKLGEDYE